MNTNNIIRVYQDLYRLQQLREKQLMATIKPLSKKALAVFNVLTQGITKVGDHRRVENSKGYMAVCVEGVGTTPQGQLIVSLAHYYEQNSDLMADPEVTFIVNGDFVFPISYKQASLNIDREYVRWDGEKLYWNLRAQRDLAGFCGKWMQNILEQQYGGKLPNVSA